MDRNIMLRSLRPDIPTISDTEMTDMERFQNDTLRPILKMQNDLIVHLFLTNSLVLKTKFESKDGIQQAQIISQNLSKNTKLKERIIGSVIGLFTTDELITYSNDMPACDKRIISMADKRLQDQLIEITEY